MVGFGYSEHPSPNDFERHSKSDAAFARQNRVPSAFERERDTRLKVFLAIASGILVAGGIRVALTDTQTGPTIGEKIEQHRACVEELTQDYQELKPGQSPPQVIIENTCPDPLMPNGK